MKILVTGSNGFIGKHMVNMLSNRYDVRTYEWGDTKLNLDNVNWVIHLGAISNTEETNIEKVLNQNLDFSIALFDECNKKKINIQWASSASVYGKNKKFSENSPLDPRSPYAWSKYLIERYVSKNEWDIIIQGFRYFNVYGDGEDHKGNQASPHSKFKWQYEQLGYVKLFEGSENFYRDFVPVEKVLEVHNFFMENVEESGIWNIGTGKPVSFFDVAKKYPIKYIKFPDNLKNSYQEYTCADLTKLNNTTNKYNKQ